MSRFDWPALMRAGISGLRLSPAEFWGLTPAELELMLGPQSGVQPMGRAQLDDLIRAFPDHEARSDTAKGLNDDGF